MTTDGNLARSGSATRRVLLALGAALVTACSGEGGLDTTRAPPPNDSVSEIGASGSAGETGESDAGSAAGRAPSEPPPPIDVEPPLDPFDDPACPSAPRVEGIRECDLFAEVSGCELGFACVPFIDYPDSRCDQEVFGTFCRRAGDGQQGDPCSRGGCADGFICIVTGHGAECARACDLSPSARCEPGLVCQPIDVEGVGGCLPP